MRRPHRKTSTRTRRPAVTIKTDPDVLTLNEVASLIGQLTGLKPHKNSVYRWVREGSSGRHLAATRVGSRYIVRRETVVAFCAAMQSGPEAAVDSEAIRQARAEEAKRRHRILSSDLGLDN